MNSKDLNSHDERSRSSSPLNIPPPSSLSSSAHHNGLPHRHHPIANSAPTTRRHIPLSPSLVDPVMEESDVVVSSRVRSYAIESTKKRRESELGDLSSPPSRRYGTLSLDGGFGRLDGHGGFDGESIQVPRELEQSVEVAEDYVKIASRNKRAEHATTNTDTLIHLLKGNIGSGLLTLPLAVGNAGLIIGPLGIFIMGLITTHCMLQLIYCARELCQKYNIKTLNYSEVAQYAVLQYAPTKPIWGKVASKTVNVFLLITQFGFCSVYFVFIADNLDQIFCSAFNISWGQRAWIAILIVPMVLLSWIRNLDELSALSMVANVCIFGSLAIILYAEIKSFVTPVEDEKAAILKGSDHIRYHGTVSTLALFFGQAVYSFEGIGMILPLENKMRSPKDAGRILTFGMILVTALFIEFGVMGYLVYGTDIKPSISLNLKSKDITEAIFFLLAKTLFAYATFGSFVLQFYVPMDFLEPPLYEKMKLGRLMYYYPRHHNKIKLLIQICFRSSVVLLIACVSLAVPDLNDLIALIGAVASSSLALIFPSILSILVFWKIRNTVRWLGCLPWPVWLTKDILIGFLGVVGTAFGTYASIYNIVKYFQDDHTQTRACIITYFPH